MATSRSPTSGSSRRRSPTRPVDIPRLAHRIGYLAPEQLVGEATSAATDVFVLGVIAYELVTGQRAYFGDSPQSLAQAILAGPPAEPSVPRPIVRVLSRCLARSQFERFPDARAFADALDAALRVAPVPGTRKDIGAQVKAVIDRHAAMNEGNLSGVVALNVGAFRPPDAISAQTLPRSLAPPTRESREASRESNEELATTNFVRPDVPVERPAPLVGPRDLSPASTIPEIPKPMTTVPGLVVPPPIPVPTGISSPPNLPIPPPIPAAPTMLGMAAAKRPQIPAVLAQIKPRPRPNGPRAPTPPPIPTSPIPSLVARGPRRPMSEPDAHDATTLDGSISGSGLESPLELLVDDDREHPQTLDTRPEDDPSRTDPVGQPTVAGGQLSDDPPTVPHDVRPEVHRRGGLQPFAVARSAASPRAPIDTSPSIEVIREDAPGANTSARPPSSPGTGPSPGVPVGTGTAPGTGMSPLAPAAATPASATDALFQRPGGASVSPTSPPFQHDRPTGQIPPELARDLKRASQSTAQREAIAPETDPLVEMSLEVHGGGRLEIPSIAPTSRPSPVGSPASTLFGLGAPGASGSPATSAPPDAGSPGAPGASASPGPSAPPPMREGSPSYDRMPSPTPPSLVTPGAGMPSPYAADPARDPNLARPPSRPQPNFSLPSQQRPRKRWPLIVLLLLIVGGGIGVFVWQMWEAGQEDEATKVASNGGSAGSAMAGSSAGSAMAGSNAGSAMVGSDAGSAMAGSGAGSAMAGSGAGSAMAGSAMAGSGAGSAMAGSGAGSATAGSGAGSATVVSPTSPSDMLQIASTPRGARVFIDGADQGLTPVKLPGSADRHTMALLLAGHDLYVAEVDGQGSFEIALKPITPTGGRAGIKVIRCKDKERYYVFVDGKPTGMTCPTERIECDLGPHTVEVYDLVTESRRKWDIKVTETRLSYRVRVD